MSKKILTIQDISCYGGCSSTAALAVLPRFGIETAVLPTALLSTHTGFDGNTFLDLTDEMPKIIDHWVKERIQFDAIYVGYVASYKQFDIILEAKDKLLKDEGLFIVDPVMGDHGTMYKGLDEMNIIGMKDLVSKADYVIPNITEACLLTGTTYQEEQDDYFINGLLADLYRLGAKTVILTSVADDEESLGVIGYDGLTKTTIMKELLEKSYPGTGDVFSSLVIANILNGVSMKENLDMATDFVMDAIDITYDDPDHNYASKYEQILKKNIK